MSDEQLSGETSQRRFDGLTPGSKPSDGPKKSIHKSCPTLLLKLIFFNNLSHLNKENHHDGARISDLNYYDDRFLILSLLFSAECTIGMVWGLTALKHYGNKALRHYGTMALWH